MDCPKLRRRTPVSKWKVGTSLLFACCAAGCANPGESAPATNLSTQQLNAEIREPIERLTHRSAAEPQVARDGTTQVVDLRGGFQSVTMVRRNPDGTFSGICTNSADEAVRFLTSEPAPAVEDR